MSELYRNDQPVVETVSGRALNRLARKLTPTARAALCEHLRNGVVVTDLTAAQTMALVGANRTFAAVWHRATPEQRQAIANGELKLAVLASKPTAGDDDELHRFVNDVAAALDRYTAPSPNL
jgi:hypothetical protein